MIPLPPCPPMKAILSALLLLVSWSTCLAAEDYEQHIKNLATGTPERVIAASLKAIKSAGIDAFPVLIAHFADSSPAEPRYFQREVSEILLDGTTRLHLPTIGEACFDILQDQVEGTWPRGFREYYVLTPANAKQWLETRKGLTLAQLRCASLEDSVRRAEADLTKKPASEFKKMTVEFLRKELEQAKK